MTTPGTPVPASVERLRESIFNELWGRATMPTAPDNHDVYDYAERIRESS